MGSQSKDAPCGCQQRFNDLARAHKASSGLIRVTCRGCGKEFVSNVETDLCYDCKKRGA
jgi:predicted SprT family Zn-dependent metalloprotease